MTIRHSVHCSKDIASALRVQNTGRPDSDWLLCSTLVDSAVKIFLVLRFRVSDTRANSNVFTIFLMLTTCRFDKVAPDWISNKHQLTTHNGVDRLDEPTFPSVSCCTSRDKSGRACDAWTNSRPATTILSKMCFS